MQRSRPGIGSRRATGRSRAGSQSSRCRPIRGRLAAVQRRLIERRRRLSLEDTWKLDQRAGRRGQRRAAGDARARRLGRHGAALPTHIPARRRPAARRDPRGGGAGGTHRKHPALVRASVSGGRRRHDRAGGGARGGCRSASSPGSGSRSTIPTLGRCRSCGKPCAPWFPLCDRCFGAPLTVHRRRRRLSPDGAVGRTAHSTDGEIVRLAQRAPERS